MNDDLLIVNEMAQMLAEKSALNMPSQSIVKELHQNYSHIKPKKRAALINQAGALLVQMKRESMAHANS